VNIVKRNTVVLGLDLGSVIRTDFLAGIEPCMIDASNFYNSTIFDPDATSGFGGWGDPGNDFQITDGAFSAGFTVSYPPPHTVRRIFTLQPWSDTIDDVFDDGSTAIHWDNTRMANFVGIVIRYKDRATLRDLVAKYCYIPSHTSRTFLRSLTLGI
jgi:hypothetical protein